MQKNQDANKSSGMKMEKSEELFRSFSEQSFVGIYLIQGDKFVYVNPKFAEIFGYTIEECINSMLFHDLIHPDDLKLVQEQIRKRLTGEISSVQYEFRGIKKNKAIIHVDIYGSTIDYKGRPAATGTILDITKRKKAEQALLKSEHQLQTIIEHSNELFYIHDTNHILTYVSPTSQAILGYPPEEMKIKWTKLATDNPINLIGVEFTENAIKTGKTQKPYLLELKKKDGSIVLVEVNESPVKDATGKVVEISGALRDVTLNKQTENRLIKSETRFRDLFNAISDLIYTQDIEGRFTSVNPAMCKAFDHKEDKLIGRPASDFMKSEFVSAFKNDYMEPLKKNGHHEGTTIYFRRNGEKIYIEYRSVLVQPEDGEPFISGTGRDVTQKILSERKVAKLQEQVIQSQKMESIATMTSGLAHDFNNILYIIFGNTELALEETPKNSPAHAKLEEIKSASIRAEGIIKQLLNFSRKTDQKLKPISAVTIIQNALNFLRSAIPATIEIRKHLTEANITILANSIQINQVLMNLCANASQAMKKAGGTLDVTVEKTTIKENSVKNFPDLAAGEYAKITITDVGTGIDPKIMTRIFDPYFTTKGKEKSSGLGLSIVHGIVKNHNGAIFVDSEFGKGATITLLFPVVDEKPKFKIQALGEIPRGNETILFVDDEKSIRIMARIMLKKLGYTVETMLDPIKALALFQLKPYSFDLVITDMTMPHMNGAKLSEKLMEIRSDIPVIICTGHSSLINEEKAEKLGLAGYIMKPVSISRLATSIRKALDKQ
jgi:PAS domain S-box-containing protein